MLLSRSCALVLFVVCSSAIAAAQTPVTTMRYDNARTGQNLAETTLTTSNVSQATFGRLFSRVVDDEAYAQPLYVPNVNIPGVGSRNVVYVATVNNSVYAFDADDPGAAAPLWRVNYNNLAAGLRPVRATDVGQNCGTYRDFSGNIGIVGTPVIDAAGLTIYFVTRTVQSGVYVQKLHALDIRTGAERPNSPVTIQASVPGTGSGSVGGTISFNSQTENQRAGLVLANNTVYIVWSSHCDTGPYHGWVLGYNPSTLAQTVAMSVTPNGSNGGIWQGGTAPAVDASGNIYLTVGNGSVTAPSGGSDYGHAFMKISPTGQVLDWFIPYNWSSLNSSDLDVGSAGVMLIPGTNLVTSGGKEGKLYVLDRSNLGHFHSGSDNQIVQSFLVAPAGRHFHGTPTYWNGPGGPYVYTWCEADRGKAFRVSGGLLTTTPVSQTTVLANNGMPGGMMTISANGTTAGTGILWAAIPWDGDANQDVRPGILRAFDAADLTHELWNSRQDFARDDFGNFAKFSYPTVTNGKVYLATFSRQLVVYGLLPPGDARPTVSAGPEQTVVMPNAAMLQGTASDDGQPGPLETAWIQVSGPGTATFADPSSPATTATFTAPGTYVLRLTASDGALAADSDVTVNVFAPGAIVGTGTGVMAQYWDNVDFTGTTITRTDPTIDFDFGMGSPDPAIGPNSFSARWTGKVQAQFTESYTFTTLSDDGVRLWINNQMVIDNWTDHGPTEDTATVSLVKGQRYDIKMEYYERSGNAIVSLSWASASTPKQIVPMLQLFPQAPPSDGTDTPGIFVESTSAWLIRNSNSPGPASLAFGYGPPGAGWTPLAGDWNGDGTATPGLYDPATSSFFLKNTNGAGGADVVFSFGAPGQGYVPIVGDWDGNGTTTVGLYQPSTGTFFLKNLNANGGADAAFTFGAAGQGYVPVVGDWDGDGRDTVGLYVPSNGTFFLKNANAPGGAEWLFTFGGSNAIPITGDWDGDGIDSIGIYIAGTGTWFMRNTNTFGGADIAFSYGAPNERPLTGNWDGQ